jgi:hypothetical protein
VGIAVDERHREDEAVLVPLTVTEMDVLGEAV